MADQVKAWFHDADEVTRAVDRLVEEKIPPDQIRVTVEDSRGTEVRELPVKERMGALRGAAWGAAGGAAFGVLAVLFLSTGAFTWVGLEPLGSGVAMGMLRAAVGGAVAGVPLGGVLGMARWKGYEKIDPHELRQGSAVVTVKGEGLLDRARRALEDVGPARVQGG